MTDAADPIDELASLHLDGRTTPDEDRRIAADPRLQERVAALRAAREAVRAEVPEVMSERREQAIAAALQAFDAERPSHVGRAIDLASHRASRLRPSRVLAVAAAVVLLALSVPLVAQLDDDARDHDELATSSGDSAEESQSSTDEADGGDSAGSGSAFGATAGPVAEAAGPAADLGSFDELGDLEGAVRATLAGRIDDDPTAGATESQRAASDAPDCTAGDGSAPVVLRASAVLEGRAVTVVVSEQADGRRTLRVTEPADCRLVATIEL